MRNRLFLLQFNRSTARLVRNINAHKRFIDTGYCGQVLRCLRFSLNNRSRRILHTALHDFTLVDSTRTNLGEVPRDCTFSLKLGLLVWTHGIFFNPATAISAGVEDMKHLNPSAINFPLRVFQVADKSGGQITCTKRIACNRH